MFKISVIATVFVVLFIGVSSPLSAQISAATFYSGTPLLGSSCPLLQPGNFQGQPTAFLDANGRIFTCKGTPPATSGVWVQYATFDAFQGTGSAVSMNGTDVPVFSFNVPPLAAGACYRLDYGIGAGLSAATIEVKVDGTAISTPFTAGSVTGVNVSVSGVQYCNVAGSQSFQSLVYVLGIVGFANFYAANSGWSYSAGFPVVNDSPISTPSAVNWSVPHTLTITVNQPSGTVIPAYAHISGGN